MVDAVIQRVEVRAPGSKAHGLGSGLVGDYIGDRRAHGGNDQAVYAYAVEDLQWCFSSLAIVQTLHVFETIPSSFHYTGYLQGDPRVIRLSVIFSTLESRKIFMMVSPE